MTQSDYPKLDQRKLDEIRGQAGRSMLRGCLITSAVLGAFLAAILVFAERAAEHWAEAKPDGMSDAQWAAKAEMCGRIQLELSECAARPDREVKKSNDEVLARELDKICAREDSSKAKQEAERVVLSALKAPASARFVSSSVQTRHDGCIWTVTGEVDAQNTFGAQLRRPYRVQLQRTAKDSWLPLQVRVD